MKRRVFLGKSALGVLCYPIYNINQPLILFKTFEVAKLNGNDRNSLINLYNKSIIFSEKNLNASLFNKYILKFEALNIESTKNGIDSAEFDEEILRVVNDENFTLTFDDLKEIHTAKFNGNSVLENVVEHYQKNEGLYEGLSLAAASVAVIIGGGLLLPAAATAAFVAEANLIAFSAGVFSTTIAYTDLFIGNSDRNTKSQNLNSYSLVKNLNENILNSEHKTFLNQLSSSTNFKFKTYATDEFQKDNQTSFIESDDNYTNEVYNKLSDSNLTKDEFENILSDFLDKVKDENENLIQNISEVKEENSKKIKENYEKGLLYQSIGNALNQIVSEFAAPKEAKAVNVLINGATQMLVQGAAFGPYGWAAVAINVGIALLDDDEDNFQEVFIEAIMFIQEQLNIIIKKLDRIEQNQHRIFEALGRIYNVIVENNEEVQKQFIDVVKTQNEILRRIGQQKREDLRSKYHNANLNLKLILKGGFEVKKSFLNEQFLDLISYSKNELNKSAFTGYIDTDISGQALKNAIFYFSRENGLEKKAIVNFYDFVGLIPLAVNYNSNANKTSSLVKLPNLNELNFTVTDILNWLAFDGLSKRQEIILLNEFNTYLDDVKNKLNSYAQKSVIDKIKSSYLQNIDSIVNDLDAYFKVHKTKFYKNKIDDLKNVCLKSNESFFINDDEYYKTISIGDSFFIKNTDERLDGFVYQYENSAREDRILYGDVTESDFDIIDEDTGTYKKKYQAQYYQPSNWDIFDLMFEVGIFSELKKVSFTGVGGRSFDYAYEHRVKGNLMGYEIDMSLIYGIVPIRNRSDWNGNLPTRLISFRFGFSKEQMFKTDWKLILKNYFKSVYNLDITTVIEDFNTTYSFIEFLTSLFQGYMNETKVNLIKEVKVKLKANNKIDGIGVSLLMLSKLNNLITSPDIQFFTSDYYDKLFIMEDYVELMEYLLKVGISHEEENNYLEYLIKNQDSSVENNNDFRTITNTDGTTRILDANSFYDFILISLKEKASKTIAYIDNLISDVSDSDCEPFLADALNKIRGYRILKEV